MGKQLTHILTFLFSSLAIAIITFRSFFLLNNSFMFSKRWSCHLWTEFISSSPIGILLFFLSLLHIRSKAFQDDVAKEWWEGRYLAWTWHSWDRFVFLINKYDVSYGVFTHTFHQLEEVSLHSFFTLEYF